MDNYLKQNKSRNYYGCMKSINIDINNNLFVSPFPVTPQEAKEVEYYKLTISNEEITLKVNYINGIVRGLETLSQVFSNKPDDEDNYTIQFTPLIIEDYPSFPIRGIMIDTSRHFISIKKLKLILDGMLHSKLNTLHWHIIDDDNFAFESKELPFISKGQNYYSQSDIRKLMDYAKVRGIQIIPEFDQPGHVRSWGLSKELSNITILNKNNTQQGFFDPSENSSISTAITILNEAIKVFKCNESSFSTTSDIFHLGGDEINYDVWLENEKIKKYMKDNNFKDQYELVNHYLNLIRKNIPDNKKYIYWIDAEFFSNEKYSKLDVFKMPNTILHYWGKTDNLHNHSNAFLNNSTNRTKFNMILSPYDYTYLDCGTGNIYGDRSWCDPFVTWKQAYKFNPGQYNNGDINVLGSIACLWSELVDDYNVIGKIFPRASALAEKLWSSFPEGIDVKKAFIRLVQFNKLLYERKIKGSRITNSFCENHVEECSKLVN